MYNHKSRGLSKVREHHVPDMNEITTEISFIVENLDNPEIRALYEKNISPEAIAELEKIAEHVTYSLAVRNVEAEDLAPA